MDNPKVFFDEVRAKLFGGKITDEQFEGIEAIFDAWNKRGTGDRRHLAYILATAYHETGRRMIPVREGQGARKAWSDAQARNAVKRLFDQGKIKRNYALPDPKTGHSYYGRGQVQLTHADNYKRIGKILGLGDRLYENPDEVLEDSVSASILVEGMLKSVSLKGDFTSTSIEQHIHDDVADYKNARKAVNGLDKADTIAGYARKFDAALQAAGAPHVPYSASGRKAAYEAVEKAVAAPAPVQAPLPAGTRVTLEMVQQRLLDLGFPKVGNVDGILGADTRGAVAAAQAHYGLAVNGDPTDQAFLQVIMNYATPKRPQAAERAEAPKAVVAEKILTARIGDWVKKAGAGLLTMTGIGAVADGTGTFDGLVKGVTGFRQVTAVLAEVPWWVYALIGAGAVFAVGHTILADTVKRYQAGKAV